MYVWHWSLLPLCKAFFTWKIFSGTSLVPRPRGTGYEATAVLHLYCVTGVHYVNMSNFLYFHRWTETESNYTGTYLWLPATWIFNTRLSGTKHSAGSEWFKKVQIVTLYWAISGTHKQQMKPLLWRKVFIGAHYISVADPGFVKGGVAAFWCRKLAGKLSN